MRVTKMQKILAYIVLIAASVASAFPLYYMAVAATNKSVDVVRGRLIPGTYIMENFKSILAQQDLARAMTNSFRNAIVLTLLAIVVCSIAGYGFEIYHDKGKDTLMRILLLAMMLPFVAIMIPLFRMFSQWHMVNNYWAFVLPSVSTPFLIMMFRQAARSFPHDIIEAARIDGANIRQQIRYITLPCLKPTVITMFILSVSKMFYSDFGLFYQVPKNSGLLYPVTMTIDTYVYNALMNQNNPGMSAAAGFLQAVVGCVLVVLANAMIRKVSREDAIF